MAQRLRVVHYVNQFFGQIGGEDKADVGPQIVQGPVGPGRLLQQLLGDRGEVVATAICGDNYFVQNLEKASDEILQIVKAYNPDLVVAGPGATVRRMAAALPDARFDHRRAARPTLAYAGRREVDPD